MNKGVTPVVATVLLMAISVAAAGTIYNLTQENVQNTKNQMDNTDFNLNKHTLRVDQCYEDTNGFINLVIRNNAQDAINASEVRPLINGSIEDYTIEGEIVGPQRTFAINLTQSFGSETLIILTDGESQIEYQCYDL